MFRKPILLIVLATFVSGCAGYRNSYLPSEGLSNELPISSEEIVQVGQVGRIFLKNGTSISGTITEVSAESVIVGKVGNYGFEETLILATDIERIEVESRSPMDPLMTGLVGTIVIGLSAIMLALLFSPPDVNFN